ncbi:MAG: hypothetical protein ACRD3N_03785 [Terracidiphilus sp.]
MANVFDNPAAASTEDLPSLEERRVLIERVAGSEEFSRSVRLRDFLLYVGNRSLKDGSLDIHEQEIGAAVFGRSTSYDRSQDNIVRVNATELRKRIELYFATTGAREALVFEIPRGGYKLVFRRRTEASPVERPRGLAEDRPPAISSQRRAPQLAQTRIRSAVHFAWPFLCLLLAIACTLLYLQNRSMQKSIHPWQNQPAVKAFWTGFLSPRKQTDVVLPDDSASVIEDIAHSPISLDDYQNREFIRRFQNSTMSADRKADVDQVFNHNLVTFGAVRAAQLVLGEIPPPYPDYLTLTRDFTTDDINRDNVVFVGGRKSVPWDYLFDSELNFITDYDYTHGLQIVRNIHPKPGEQAIYTVPFGPNSTTGYATIAYVPNPSHTGSVIILGGTDSDATGAAASFLTSGDQMEKLRKTLHSDRFPYFEVLLKTSRLSGAFFGATPIAYRIYPRPQ